MERGFMPTFKVQGQVYHLIGSVLPQQGEDHKFLQIYFMGNEEDERQRRCGMNENLREGVVMDLQVMLHEHNELVKGFKYAYENPPSMSRDFKIVVSEEKGHLGSTKEDIMRQ